MSGQGQGGTPALLGGARETSNSLWSAKRVADRLGVSVWFVYDHGGELGLVKVGGANRYRVEAVEAYIELRSRPASVAGVSVGSPNRRSRRERPGKVRLLEPATALRPDRRAA